MQWLTAATTLTKVVGTPMIWDSSCLAACSESR